MFRLVLLLLIVAPVAQAAWTDEAGDQRLGRATHFQDGEPQYSWFQADDQEWYRNVDLIEASITETAGDLVFRIQVASTEAEEPPPVPGMPHFEEFMHGFSFHVGEVEYHVGLFDSFFGDPGPHVALLHRFDIFGQSLYFPSYRMDASSLSDGWSGSLPKAIFRDEDMVPLREGDVLRGVRAFAIDNDLSFGNLESLCPGVGTQGQPPSFGLCTWTVQDELDPVEDVAVTMTPPGVGHLFLRMEKPYRMSNGLATTYLFEARLHNLEAEPDTVTLQVSDLPPRWEVRLPGEIEFQGQGSTMVPLALTVPFQHVHGENQFLTLTALSQRNASAAVEGSFGVIFADPPQPAGHHDTLWFHAEETCPPDFSFSCGHGYMNADRDPEEPRSYQGRFIDELEAEPGHYNFADADTADEPALRTWRFALAPTLGIGLDFDPGKTGMLEATLRFDEDWTGDVDVQLLLHRWEAPDVLLASGNAQAEFRAGQAQGVQVSLAPTAASDRVPFERGQNLALVVNVTDTSGLPWHARQGQAVAVVADMQMRLPLLDFHEDVDLSGLDLPDLRIERLNNTFKALNPGKTAVFMYNVTNMGQRHVVLDWALAGEEHYRGWARVEPAATHLSPGRNGTVVVAVTAPASATAGDVAELLLVGTARHDSDLQVFGRLVAAVDENREIPDEAGSVEQFVQQAERENRANEKKSPLPLPVAALLLAALRRR